MERFHFPPLIFLFFFTTTSLLGSPFLVSSLTNSCNSDLSVSGLPFDTASFQCNSVWDSKNFILRYKQTSQNQWSFVLSTPDSNSYVAIGFSSNGRMVGSSAVVGWISGTGVIKQYHLGGKSPAQVVADQGTLNVTSSTITSQTSRLYLAFQLNTTAPPSSKLIYSVGPVGTFPASPEYSLTEHRDMTSTSLNYVTGETSSGASEPYTRLRRAHGILNMLGWGILIIIGVIVARHMRRWDPLWFHIHGGIQLLGFIFGLIGVISGLILENRLGAHVSKHKGLGIFILVLGCLQMMAILARPDKSSKVRKYWNWYHYSVGRILIVFAVANVFYGIHLGESGHGWSAAYGIIVAILFVVSLVLEIRSFIKK